MGPGADPHKKKGPSTSKVASEERLLRGILDMSKVAHAGPAGAAAVLSQHALGASLVRPAVRKGWRDSDPFRERDCLYSEAWV